MWTQTAPSCDAIEQFARQALDALPAPFTEAAQAVALRVIEEAPAEVLQDLSLSDPLELTGLYDGIPLTEKSLTEQSWAPDVIWLYRRAILEEWIDRGNVPLDRLVTHVLVHELAHLKERDHNKSFY
ncbi:MAG: metallopeptidase family protein, partial [Mangrovicoccus sp.]